MRNLGIFILIMVAIVGGIFFLSRGEDAAPANSNGDTQTSSIPDPREDDHARGASEAAVVIVEYSDFQCPACKSAHGPLAAFVDANAENVKFIYRHFPLTTIHKHAQAAAYASEAAALQGKFWEMHDKLFEKQSEWSASREPVVHFVNYAKELGLDLDKFSSDYDSEEVRASVDQDAQDAAEANLPGTPSLFVNGGRYDLALGLEPLQELVTQLANIQEQVSEATESGAPASSSASPGQGLTSPKQIP
jgi:protein-disulfide isomerase